MTQRVRVASLLLLATPWSAWADSSLPEAPLANTQLADPGQEAAAKELMLTIRCLVCQGQSVADSDAEMAADMRALIRTRIKAGERPETIRSWLVERYGKWISYDAPLGSTTMLLWIAPLLLLGVGGLLVRTKLRRRK